MSPTNFNREQEIRVRYIEEVINKFLPKEEGYQKVIFEAMNYSILAGGKRLRPMLMLETYKLFDGKDLTCIEPFIAAIEMIHTYSLVHDDLPAMDNDEYRRGRKTTHVVFGEAFGILAGDALLNYAFETTLKAITKMTDNNLKNAVKALEVLSAKAGIYGMIAGQVIDITGVKSMDSSGNELDKEKAKQVDNQVENLDNAQEKDSENINKLLLDKLNCMYQLKTGALIEASMMIGAIMAGANEKEILVVEQMASDIGLAFQIQDDILDVTSTTEILGKPVLSDERNEKVTYVTIMGIDHAKSQVESLSQAGLNGFEQLNRDNEFLRELIIKLITREK
jgi:geranylgeranyl diphosphate synthase, type II